MLTKYLITIFFATTVSAELEAAHVNFNNLCSYAIHVHRKAGGERVKSECYLEPGASCSRNYSSNGYDFMNNWDGKSIAGFEFGKDVFRYHLDVTSGFDVPLQIESHAGGVYGPTVTCRRPNCPAAFNCYDPDDFDEDLKIREVSNYNTFDVNFCPLPPTDDYPPPVDY